MARPWITHPSFASAPSPLFLKMEVFCTFNKSIETQSRFKLNFILRAYIQINKEQILGEIGPLVVIIAVVEFFHPGTLAQTLMSGSFKGSREGWACIIFNTSD